MKNYFSLTELIYLFGNNCGCGKMIPITPQRKSMISIAMKAFQAGAGEEEVGIRFQLTCFPLILHLAGRG